MTKPKRRVRDWTPEERAAALALLQENGGNMKATVRQFKTADGAQISESTLRGWRDNPEARPAPKFVIDAKRDRIAVLKSILRKLEQGFDAALDQYPELVPSLVRKQPSQLATTIGILTDKVRLLEGEATAITEMRTLGGFLAQAKWLEAEPQKDADAKLN